jgi:hypothetical protein
VRYDNSNQAIFPGDDFGSFKKNQTTLTLGQTFAF